MRFADLFTGFLERQKYRIDPKGSGVLKVSCSAGNETWVTNTGFTSLDRSVVLFVMRRHRRIRQLLSIAGVATLRGREVTTAARLKRFTEGRVSSIILFPITGSWEGPNANVLTADEVMEMSALPTKMWVQTRPPGVRLRVLATPDKSWVITSKQEPQPVSKASISAAGDLAVRAVRAVPELRWAAVDVLVRPRRLQESRPGGALIEGLTLVPKFAPEDEIIAGDFDAFAHRILEL